MIIAMLIIGIILLLVMMVTLAWAIGTRMDLLKLKGIVDSRENIQKEMLTNQNLVLTRIVELEKGNDYLDDNLNESFDSVDEAIEANNVTITQIRDSIIELNKEVFRVLRSLSELHREIDRMKPNNAWKYRAIIQLREEMYDVKKRIQSCKVAARVSPKKNTKKTKSS